jgi:hypothetical protein
MTHTLKGLIPAWVLIALAAVLVIVAAVAALALSSQPAEGGGGPTIIEVHKVYDPVNEFEDFIIVTLVCDEGVEFTPDEANADPDTPAEFTITASDKGDTCDAVEVDVPSGFTADLSDCVDLVATDDGDECTITNILNETTVTVHKVFADDVDDKKDNDNGNDTETSGGNDNDELEVQIFLACPEHVTVEPDTIVDATEAKDNGVWTAEFLVSFFNPGDTCTATEVPIEGWIGFSVDCIDIDLMPEDDDKNDNDNNDLAGNNENDNGIECLITNLPAQSQLWGDVDCNGTVSIGDAVKIARALLDLPVDQEEGCPEIGALVVVMQAPEPDDKNDEKNDNGNDNDKKTSGDNDNDNDKNGNDVIVTTELWGDVDCGGDVLIGDAVKIARWLIDLSVDQEELCPEIGQEVLLGIVPPDDDDEKNDEKNDEKEE